ncbi:MAG: DNA replication/repair protein RecF [Geminicoccaceae bacterium]|nr:DNA replication/repair protein RecF [Geminicoccaceae bacterium]
MAAPAPSAAVPIVAVPPPTAVTGLALKDFRNYGRAHIEAGPGLVVLYGPNGSGKTNLLEALSLLAPGRGLRRAALAEIDRDGGAPWRLEAVVDANGERVEVETGRDPDAERRFVRLFGEPARGQGALARTLGVVWLVPSMDRLFQEGAAARRRFLDRLALAVFPDHATTAGAYEKGLRERAVLLRTGRRDPAWLGALERRMAENAVAVAAARRELVNGLNRLLLDGFGALPRVVLTLEGEVEAMLDAMSALDAEGAIRDRWRWLRDADAVTGGSGLGVHRSDLVVADAVSGELAARCSTGRQKAMLLAVTLAEARLRQARLGDLPILLLDEVAAHLDGERRERLCATLVDLGAQAWLTGTDPELFAALHGRARFLAVEEGRLHEHD